MFKFNPLSGVFDMVTTFPGSSLPVGGVPVEGLCLAGGGIPVNHGQNLKFKGIIFECADLTTAMAYANDIKLEYNFHIADAVIHGAPDGVNVIAAANAIDYTTLLALVTDILTQYAAHNADAELGVGWTYHIAQNAVPHVLSSVVAPTTFAEIIVRILDVMSKYTAHDTDAVSHSIGGLHGLIAGTPSELWQDTGAVTWIEDATDPLNQILVTVPFDMYLKSTFLFT